MNFELKRIGSSSNISKHGCVYDKTLHYIIYTLLSVVIKLISLLLLTSLGCILVCLACWIAPKRYHMCTGKFLQTQIKTGSSSPDLACFQFARQTAFGASSL